MSLSYKLPLSFHLVLGGSFVYVIVQTALLLCHLTHCVPGLRLFELVPLLDLQPLQERVLELMAFEWEFAAAALNLALLGMLIGLHYSRPRHGPTRVRRLRGMKAFLWYGGSLLAANGVYVLYMYSWIMFCLPLTWFRDVAIIADWLGGTSWQGKLYLYVGSTAIGRLVPAVIACAWFCGVAGFRPKPFKGKDVCQHCGYSLGGSVTGICPECGERAEDLFAAAKCSFSQRPGAA